MAKLTEAQQKRADARERRRRSGPASEKAGDASTEENGASEEQPLDAVMHAAKVAAAGAAVGAAAAAARALTRNEDDDEGSPVEAETAPAAEQGQEEPEAGQLESSAENTEERSAAVAEPRSDDELQGATPDDARETVQRAREQLEALLERPVESVSSFERTHDGWLVTMEVVEVSRIPESTDVLASYEVELDQERNLRRYARVRRYNRSQANLGDQS